jgi:primosomal protein N' (replication factor Y)
VVNADTALHMPDFRAAERTFQLVAQVAGRTGRGDRPGRVIVQTYSPEAPAIRHAVHHDYLGFVQDELPRRASYAVPPFGRIIRVVARAQKPAQVLEYITALASILSRAERPGVRVLGPALAPVAKIRNLHRFHLQLRGSSIRPLQELLAKALSELTPPSDVEVAVDVDPVNLL